MRFVSKLYIIIFLLTGIYYQANRVDSDFDANNFMQKTQISQERKISDNILIKPTTLQDNRVYSNSNERVKLGERKNLAREQWNDMLAALLGILFLVAIVLRYGNNHIISSNCIIINYIHHQDGNKGISILS